LLELFSAIHTSLIPVEPYRLSEKDRQFLTDHGQKQSKSAKIAEWKSLPLDTDEHRYAWWRMKCDLIAETVQGNECQPFHNSPPQLEEWTDTSPASTQYAEPPSQVVGQSHLQGIQSPQLLEIPWHVSSETAAQARTSTTLSNLHNQPAANTSPITLRSAKNGRARHQMRLWIQNLPLIPVVQKSGAESIFDSNNKS
jgi:ABC-type uncharacterized transport system YnjBCD substrate-binding protein